MNNSVNATQLDAISLEIMWQRLISVMDEIDNATVRTSFSTIVGESRDFACVLLDQAGDSICQSSFSPPDFCVILPRTTRSLLERFPVETLQEGDVLFTNDAWLGAGHLPDCVVVTPVFWQGKVVAFMGRLPMSRMWAVIAGISNVTMSSPKGCACRRANSMWPAKRTNWPFR